MHEFLRSIGFSEIRTKKQLQALTDWVLEKPDHLSVVSLSEDSNLAVAEREIAGLTGVSVVGEVDEHGTLVPEYYFPYLSSSHITSEARISYEQQSSKMGYYGMCEDFRLGMSLIFTVKNITEVVKNEQDDPFDNRYSKVMLSALASGGTVLLPIMENEKVADRAGEEKKHQLMQAAAEGDPQAIEAVAGQDVDTYRQVMDRLQHSDVFSLVDSFFMPDGLESDRYYFLGKILASQLLQNRITGERFYRLLVESNGLPFAVAVNEQDLEGVPEPGYRIKCHVWMVGEIRK